MTGQVTGRWDDLGAIDELDEEWVGATIVFHEDPEGDTITP